MFWWLMKKKILTVSWLSGLLSAEIFISTGEWGVQMPPLTAENRHFLRSGPQEATLVMLLLRVYTRMCQVALLICFRSYTIPWCDIASTLQNPDQKVIPTDFFIYSSGHGCRWCSCMQVNIVAGSLFVLLQTVLDRTLGHSLQSPRPKSLGHKGTWTTHAAAYAWLVRYITPHFLKSEPPGSGHFQPRRGAFTHRQTRVTTATSVTDHAGMEPRVAHSRVQRLNHWATKVPERPSRLRLAGSLQFIAKLHISTR